MESAQLVEQVLQASFAVKSFFDTILVGSGRVGSGWVRSDDVDSDNRANYS